MTPAEIEAKVRGAHVEAPGNRFVQRRRGSRIDELVRDARLYPGPGLFPAGKGMARTASAPVAAFQVRDSAGNA